MNTHTLKRDIPLEDMWDVLVVGGGLADEGRKRAPPRPQARDGVRHLHAAGAVFREEHVLCLRVRRQEFVDLPGRGDQAHRVHPVHVRPGLDDLHCCLRQGDDIEVRIYGGADACFILYEDAGDGYAYETGEHSTIEFRWDDAAGRLTIGPREGSFPGMLAARRFSVVLVRPGVGVGIEPVPQADASVSYTGESVSVDVRV